MRFVAIYLSAILSLASLVTAQSHLYTFNGYSPRDQFGLTVSGAGDVNGDGYDDVIVGANTAINNGEFSGSARVFSGLNGILLYTFDGDSAGDQLGGSVSGAGDVNGDGHDDVVVGAVFAKNGIGHDTGSARVFSGVDGKTLYTYRGDSRDDRLGFSVSGAGDANGDGYADVVVGALTDDNNGTNSGMARVFSGVDGSILYSFDGDSAGDLLGRSVRGAGDVDGDGYPDIIAGALSDDNNGNQSGSARVFSGANGGILYTLDGDSAEDAFGFAVSGGGDVNGDGYADVIVGVFGDNLRGGTGWAQVFSGVLLPLTSDTHLISIAGGTQTLSLSAGSENGGRRYLMLGSLGTSPGFRFGRHHIPLNPDIWFWVTVLYGILPGFDSSPYANPFGQFKGQLDIDGKAEASFTLHEESLRSPTLNDPSLVGTTFWHAYVVRRGLFGIEMVSNAVPVTIAP